LKEDPTRYYYLNTFTSTSSVLRTANSFSKSRGKNSGVIYNFLVRHDTQCIYIDDIENEILINPYQLYRYIKKKDNIHYYYILPSNMNIPSEYKQFIEFRSELLDKSNKIYGGRMKTYNIEKITRKNTKKYINKTRKNNEMKKQLSREHFRERMNLPIGTSSIGFKGTKEMDEEFDEIRKRFNL
jgi:hypothetical protein